MITWRNRNERGEPVGVTYYLQFDAVTVEEFIRPADITEYPVESGGVLADHYQPLPRQFTLYGVVSDTPIRAAVPLEGDKQDAAPPAAGFTALKQLDPPPRRAGPLGVRRPIVTGILPSQRLIRANVERARLYIPRLAKVLQFPGPVTRIVDVLLVLDGLMEERMPVNVLTFDEAEFTNMMISNLRAPRVSGSGGSVEFSLDMRQVQTADATKSPIAPAQVRHVPREDTGKTGTDPVEAGTPESSRALDTPWWEKVPDSTKSKSLR